MKWGSYRVPIDRNCNCFPINSVALIINHKNILFERNKNSPDWSDFRVDERGDAGVMQKIQCLSERSGAGGESSYESTTTSSYQQCDIRRQTGDRTHTKEVRNMFFFEETHAELCPGQMCLSPK